jgi:hypothetical protein
LGDLALVDLYWEMVRDRTPSILKLNILISYRYFKGQRQMLLRLRREGKIGLSFLDAQTFGDNPDGENPGLIDRSDEYRHVIKREGPHFDYIANLDDRFNEPRHNQLNYAALRKRFSHITDASGRRISDKLVPVTHNRDIAADEFLDYAEQGAKLIGIGSKPMVTDEQWKSIDEVRTEMNVRAHRFGNLGFQKLVDLKINSADSARYAQATMHGREMWFWDDKVNKPVSITLRSNKVTQRHVGFLAEYFDLTLNDVLADPRLLWVVNLYTMQKAQQYLTEVLHI